MKSSFGVCSTYDRVFFWAAIIIACDVIVDVSMHHICANGISNDNVYQNVQVVFNDKDIHSSLSVVKEKVGDLLLNMCSTFQNYNCDNVSKCIVRCYTFTLARAFKQMGT
jgi:hypothetical protein